MQRKLIIRLVTLMTARLSFVFCWRVSFLSELQFSPSQLLPLSDTTRTAHCCCCCCCYFCAVLVSFHARVHDNGNPRWLAPTSARSIRQLMVAFISLRTEKHGERVLFGKANFFFSNFFRECFLEERRCEIFSCRFHASTDGDKVGIEH